MGGDARAQRALARRGPRDGLTARSPEVDIATRGARMGEMADEETLADRLIMTFELFEFGVEMMAANLRRRHPDATPEKIEQLLGEWLAERPGAELGDGPGVPVPLSRFR